MRPDPPNGDTDRPRIVIDTNVVVAALLHPGRTPSIAIEFAVSAFRLVVDARIEAEYRDVLDRKKFSRIPVEARDALLDRLLAVAERIDAAPYGGFVVDDDDRAFVEVALSSGASVLLTGNGDDFPKTLAFDVLSPAELVARLTAPPRAPG